MSEEKMIPLDKPIDAIGGGMNFSGVSLRFVNGEDGKYGIVVVIPSHLKVKTMTHKKPNSAVDPLGSLEAVGINLEEA